MGKRITIVIDEEIEKKLRLIQSRIINKEVKNCSFSRVVNDTLEKGLK